MKQPTIGVFIPTPGRKSLARTLHSILTQRLIHGDQVVIIADGHDQWTQDLVRSLGSPFEYYPTKQTRDWGHSQCNFGMQCLKTDIGVAQDDDDIFAPRAFEEIRKAVIDFPDSPIMARVKTPSWGILWSQPVTLPFDGHCLIYPNIKEKLGTWGSTYDGDQLYIRSTLENYSSVGWLDKVISLTRPTWKLWAQPVHGWGFTDTLRRIRNSCKEYMTNFTDEISVNQQTEWFEKLDHQNNWYWLFYNDQEPIGFIGLNKRDEKMYATYGLFPQWRGKGLGRELVEFSLWAAQEELTIEVLTSNERAIKLYQKCGFQEHWTRDGIIEMYSEWPPRI